MNRARVVMLRNRWLTRRTSFLLRTTHHFLFPLPFQHSILIRRAIYHLDNWRFITVKPIISILFFFFFSLRRIDRIELIGSVENRGKIPKYRDTWKKWKKGKERREIGAQLNGEIQKIEGQIQGTDGKYGFSPCLTIDPMLVHRRREQSVFNLCSLARLSYDRLLCGVNGDGPACSKLARCSD